MDEAVNVDVIDVNYEFGAASCSTYVRVSFIFV